MKVKEFKELVGKKGLQDPEVSALVKGKDDNAEMWLIDRNDYFASKLWDSDDVAGVIKDMGYEPTPEKVADVINHGGGWGGLNDCTDSEWDCILREAQAVLCPYYCEIRYDDGTSARTERKATVADCVFAAVKRMAPGVTVRIIAKEGAIADYKSMDEAVWALWDTLVDVPFDDEALDEDWFIFEKGTGRDEIWLWFDEHYSKGVAALLSPDRGNEGGGADE